MPWKYDSEDDIFEIVLGSVSLESLLALAGKRVTYVVDTPANKQIIDDCWKAGAKLDLYEVSRCEVTDPENHQGNLESILQLIETHHWPYRGIAVHGTAISQTLIQTLAKRGISIIEHTQDGFVASLAKDAPVPMLWALTEFLEKGG